MQWLFVKDSQNECAHPIKYLDATCTDSCYHTILT